MTSSPGKTTVCAWIGFAGQIFVLALFYHFETYVAAGDALYVRELFTIGSGTWSVPVSWLGIIGVLVPVASPGDAYDGAGAEAHPQKFALTGRFVNESSRDSREGRPRWAAPRSGNPTHPARSQHTLRPVTGTGEPRGCLVGSPGHTP